MRHLGLPLAFLCVIACSAACGTDGSRSGTRTQTVQPDIARDILEGEARGARLFAVQRVAWSDTCLGLDCPGLQAVTPGYIVLIQRRGWLIQYHTDLHGNYFRFGTLRLADYLDGHRLSSRLAGPGIR